MAELYWKNKFDAATGMYKCPWCERDLKPKLSNSAKNPGKTFVSCSKDFAGCGLFSFLDAVPDEKFNPFTKAKGLAKRPRSDDGAQPPSAGTNVLGPVVNQPDVHEKRLAELALAIDKLTSAVVRIEDYVRQVTEN
jgi:hypothetical protein